MAPEKAPAFQFYPKDYLSDPRVRAMSFEQRGLYWEAVCICWLEGSLPSDLSELAAILGCSPKRLTALWPRIGPCFETHGERLTHKRLDKERAAQSESRDRRAEAARKRWEKDAMHMQSSATEPSPADAKQCSPSSSSSASPSSTAVKESTRARPALQGSGAFEAGSLPRDHMHHSLCGPDMKICLLRWQYDVLAKAYNAPDNPHGTRAVISQFIEVLEKGVTPNDSIGPFKWVETEFHTYLKSIGRVAPKIETKPKHRSVAELLAEETAKKNAERVQ